MKPGRLKRSILIFSCIALLLTPVQLSDACGWTDDDFVPFTVIFDRGFFSPREPKSFDLFSDVLFNFDENPKDDHEKNTEEWQAFLRGISKEEAHQLVYNSTLQELGVIQKNLTSNIYPDDVTTALSKIQWQSVVPYLLFVRKCQPYVNEFDDWAGCFEKQDVFTNLFQEGEDIAAKASSDFMKVRIGYQLCRLAHYMGDIPKCVSYYEQMIAPLKSESIVYYWAMAHYAAAQKSKGKLAEAQLLYAEVYRRCTTKRLSSFRSIDYSEVDSALNLAQDPGDKISLYVLNSLENGTNNLANMQAIYKLDPRSPELEVLLYKEIYSFELSKGWSPNTNGDNKPTLQFAEDVIAAGQMYRPYVWQLSAGYLSFLNKDYDKAHEYYSQVKETAGNITFLKQYVTLLDVVLKAAETTEVDITFEESIQRYLAAMANIQEGSKLYETTSRITQYVYQLLYKTYKSENDLVKAELVAPHFYTNGPYTAPRLYDHPDSSLVSGLITFVNRTDLNKFENFLVEKFPYTKEQLMELQGTMLFRKGYLKEAVSYFEKSGELEEIKGDPFLARTQDCIDCGEDPQPITYNKKSLALQIIKYATAATANAKDVAENYFFLGNAWYNITSFGPQWKHLAYDRPWGDMGSTTDPFENFWGKNKIDTVALQASYKKEESKITFPEDYGYSKEQGYFYDCTRALYYYKMALKSSSEPEFKAKCVFMMAKCEENARIVAEPIAGLKIGTHTYYSKLYNEYANTQFYSEIIQECSYVRNYKDFRDNNK